MKKKSPTISETATSETATSETATSKTTSSEITSSNKSSKEYQRGYDAGYDAKCNEIVSAASASAYAEGYALGREDGLLEAKKTIYDEVRIDAYKDGFWAAKDDLNSEAYDNGFDKGCLRGLTIALDLLANKLANPKKDLFPNYFERR